MSHKHLKLNINKIPTLNKKFRAIFRYLFFVLCSLFVSAALPMNIIVLGMCLNYVFVNIIVNNKTVIEPGISRDKTMDYVLMYIPNDN